MNNNERKIQALRNLAERPGTDAEGAAAREALRRLRRKAAGGTAVADHSSKWAAYRFLAFAMAYLLGFNPAGRVFDFSLIQPRGAAFQTVRIPGPGGAPSGPGLPDIVAHTVIQGASGN